MKKNKIEEKSNFLFDKENFKFLLIGLGVIVLGFVLMSGGGNENPAIFNSEVFSVQRIRVAPTLVLLGFGIIIYSIFKKK